MNWLVTYCGSETDEDVRRHLRAAGASVDPRVAAIPMGEGERVFEISAPSEVAAELARIPGVQGVYPNSEQTAY